MKTLGQRIRERKIAEAAGSTPAADARASNQQELMLAALWQHRQQLKSIESIERKIEYKRAHVDDFVDYVDGVLEADQGGQNDVLMNIMLWRFDIGDLARAVDIAEYAMRHGLEAPDRFKRSLPALITEQTAEESLAILGGDDEEDLVPLIEQLHTIEALTESADMHDQIRAKLYKAIGYAERSLGHAEQALDALTRAFDLNSKIGVKKDIEKLQREVNKQNADG